MSYSHAPALTALKALPKKADEWNDLLQPYRDRYADIPEVVEATNPRDMLLALFDLCWALLRGDHRNGTYDERVENYDACVADYQALQSAAESKLAAA